MLSYIELFQGRLHDFIEEGMQRGSKYLPMIQNVFRAEGLPLDLAYVPLVESAFKPNALVPREGQGRLAVHDRHRPRERPAARLVHRRAVGPGKGHRRRRQIPPHAHKIFDGDWHLALASYNGGPGRVQRAIKRAAQTISGSWRTSPECCRAKRANTCR